MEMRTKQKIGGIFSPRYSQLFDRINNNALLMQFNKNYRSVSTVQNREEIFGAIMGALMHLLVKYLGFGVFEETLTYRLQQ